MPRLLTCSPLLAFALAACGGGEATPPAPSNSDAPAPASTDTSGGGASTSAPSAVKDWDPAAGTVSVTGRTIFTGDAPKRRSLDMGSDPKCEGLHAEKLLDESALVGAGGELANVFVYVRKGLEGWKFATPTEAVQVTQEGCTYVPHVLGVRVGQPLEISNGDPVSHNVHGYAKKNPGFNQTQAPGAAVMTKVFNRSEVLVPLKCDIHGWMSTFVGVVENPFFAVSAVDGSFDLGQLPPGDYQIAARHEIFGLQKQDITITAAGAQTIEFSFSEE